ncbi:hypothetical protein [Aeromicrobium sp. Leaf291]|uniref:hypothetical protein n=1 Tax=Aeromicrobium sp. Leaf291 TaxID=1736325 RepID=UPI0006FB1F8C|nr:hypothetical protein [Aeromicrobium sp. Leaf291]KQP81602.1 hypothetical protein ASF35_16355 [Aeromicrobium sp. Leaf291]
MSQLARPVPVRHEAPCGAVVLGRVDDHRPTVVTAVAQTPCCKADGVPAPDAPTGATCGACHRPVAAAYASSGWTAAYQAARDARCPVPESCADNALHRALGGGL